MNSVITVKDNKVVIDVNILGIPELKAVYDAYDEETRLLAFLYLHFLYDLDSPYRIGLESDREEKVRKAYRGNYNPKFDQVMIEAAEFMKEMNYSPIGDLLDGVKTNINKLANTLRTEEISTGNTGNMAQFLALHKGISDISKNYRSLEKDYLQDIEKNRGNSKRAIDEDDEDY